jgi:Tol biopolymer transport system component
MVARRARCSSLLRVGFPAIIALSILALPTPWADAAFPGGNGTIVFSRFDGNALTSKLVVMNADGTGERVLRSGIDPEWSPDGRRILFNDRFGGGIYVMRADGTGAHRIATGSDPTWAPDGRRIAFVRSGDIFSAFANGQGQRRLTRNPWSDFQPDWSPDGDQIAFVRERPGKLKFCTDQNIFVMDTDGSDQANLTRDVGTCELNHLENWSPDWHPDGNVIGYINDAEGLCFGNADIETIRPDGSDRKRVVRAGLSGQGGFSWSPDGRHIVMGSLQHDRELPDCGAENVNYELVRVNLARGTTEPLTDTDDPVDETSPDWRPRCTVAGTSGDDQLIGTVRSDVICGFGGRDTISGLGGDDVIFAGRGADTVQGGAGHDLVLGEKGDDALVGGPGADRLFGDRGDDRLLGADSVRGNDEVRGGPGSDLCTHDPADVVQGCP